MDRGLSHYQDDPALDTKGGFLKVGLLISNFSDICDINKEKA